MKKIKIVIAIGAMLLVGRGYGMEEEITKKEAELNQIQRLKGNQERAKELIQELFLAGRNVTGFMLTYKGQNKGKNPLEFEGTQKLTDQEITKKEAELNQIQRLKGNQERAKELIQELGLAGRNVTGFMLTYKGQNKGKNPLIGLEDRITTLTIPLITKITKLTDDIAQGEKAARALRESVSESEKWLQTNPTERTRKQAGKHIITIGQRLQKIDIPDIKAVGGSLGVVGEYIEQIK